MTPWKCRAGNETWLPVKTNKLLLSKYRHVIHAGKIVMKYAGRQPVQRAQHVTIPFRKIARKTFLYYNQKQRPGNQVVIQLSHSDILL